MYEFISAVNPTHIPTIAAARQRFGIDVEVPERAPIVRLNPGDHLIVMSVRGLPRMEGRHEYTPEEIRDAEFRFAHYAVVEAMP